MCYPLLAYQKLKPVTGEKLMVLRAQNLPTVSSGKVSRLRASPPVPYPVPRFVVPFASLKPFDREHSPAYQTHATHSEMKIEIWASGASAG